MRNILEWYLMYFRSLVDSHQILYTFHSYWIQMILLPFESQKMHPQSYQTPQSPRSACNDGVLFFWNFKVFLPFWWTFQKNQSLRPYLFWYSVLWGFYLGNFWVCSLSGAPTNSDQRRIFRGNFSGFFAYVEVELAAGFKVFQAYPTTGKLHTA